MSVTGDTSLENVSKICLCDDVCQFVVRAFSCACSSLSHIMYQVAVYGRSKIIGNLKPPGQKVVAVAVEVFKRFQLSRFDRE